MNNKTYTSAKPFVKWVGGKTQLLEDIKRALPSDLSKKKDIVYVEPFVGGGAVLFWILQQFPNIKTAIINDINPHLITTYRVIKEQPGKLIELLKCFQSEYIPLNEDNRKIYYLNRRDIYNSFSLSDIETAALFIFLNRTCFNGLYRVNSKGKFNVPHGRYANPKICDEETILADSRILQKVEILCGDFAKTIAYATSNALFYFDPPYKPLSKTSSFNSYAKEEFDDGEQIRLRDFCHQVSAHKANFILSNSDVKGKDENDNFFDEIYNAYNIQRVMATRMVNANPDKRGKLPELLIRNYEINEPTLFTF
ncbi:MAG TPA: DNA adenine methylase [Candidatus Bacteroides pullicola]|uniref:site-specific DNA-methyltransferase (adenine-specific) n=1 Tax=Candidatus Bacteroides pullicola TaxID=2838475 RepID=A0A9D1ZFF6_9BACE|nr:DNA adenine methylase [Candidatus Bacteroides pullicola]